MAAQVFSVKFDGYWRERNATGMPSHSGVYCVYECTYNITGNTVTLHKLIYIGEAENVSDRVAKHEKKPAWVSLVHAGNEMCYSCARVEPADRERIEAALVFKHKPPVNTKYRDSFPYDKTEIQASGATALLVTTFDVERTT